MNSRAYKFVAPHGTCKEWYNVGPGSATRSLPRNAENPNPFKSRRSPFRSLPDGDDPAFIVPDPAHTYAIAGWGKDFVASSIFLLFHMGRWGTGSIPVRLEFAFDLFKAWCRENHRTTSLTAFRLKTFKVTSMLY